MENNQNQCKLLYEIGMLDFICLEMNLYLDTHPNEAEAIQYFQYYSRLYKQAKREYAVKFGPLCIDDIDIPGSGNQWKWAKQPFPWEEGAVSPCPS